jgi:hypothetical protein
MAIDRLEKTISQNRNVVETQCIASLQCFGVCGYWVEENVQQNRHVVKRRKGLRLYLPDAQNIAFRKIV